MLCENCQQRPATVHQAVISNGNKTESHLCEVCAREKGHLHMPNFSLPNFGIDQLLAGLLGMEGSGPALQVPTRAEPRCPACGMTYSQFAESGRLGCGECYEHLEKQLTPLIRRIHTTTTHTGKVPKRTGGLVRLKKELLQAKEELNRAVANEQFEQAAQVRDRIKSLEARLKAGGDGGVVE